MKMKIHKIKKYKDIAETDHEPGDIFRVQEREQAWRWVVAVKYNRMSFGTKKEAVEFSENWKKLNPEK